MTQVMTFREQLETLVKLDLDVLFDPSAYAESELKGVHDLAYGPTGSGKTYMLAMLALWLKKKHGKVTRWITGDQGFQTISNLGLVKSGVVEVCDYSARPMPVTQLERLSEGYWPKGGNDPVLLEKPTAATFERVGLWVFEGFGAAAKTIMGNVRGGFADQSARGVNMGTESVVRLPDDISIVAGEKSMIHATQVGWTPINMAQDALMGFKRRTDSLPHAIWTTWECDAKDKKENNKNVIGPLLVGKAMTPDIAGMFGNTLHFCTATKMVKRKDEFTGAEVSMPVTVRRLYTQRHYDPDGTVFVEYIAGNRCPIPGAIKEYYPLVGPLDALQFYVDLAAARREMLAFASEGVA